jgi:pimeloyl-ACP methyl ester carboxylesterase
MMYFHWRDNAWQDLDDSYQLAWLLAESVQGGGDFHEVMRAAHQIRAGAAEDWAAAFKSLGDRTKSIGDEAAASGHEITARECYLRAFSYYRCAELRIPVGDSRKLAAYRSAIEAWNQGLPRSSLLYEPVNIECAGSDLHGYLFFPRRKDPRRREPCVIVIGDDESICEANFFRAAQYITARGTNCLIFDGPGQGRALRIDRRCTVLEYERPVASVLDYLETRSDIDARSIALLGFGMGGYQALRAVSFDRRVNACATSGAMHHVLHDLYLNYPPAQDQLKWVSGSRTDEEARTFYDRFTLEGLLENVRCSVLMAHGIWDKKVPLAAARRIFEGLRTEQKELKTFDDTTGGGEHCCVDNWSQVISMLADWLVARARKAQ